MNPASPLGTGHESGIMRNIIATMQVQNKEPMPDVYNKFTLAYRQTEKWQLSKLPKRHKVQRISFFMYCWKRGWRGVNTSAERER
jgi:hypothetical protein